MEFTSICRSVSFSENSSFCPLQSGARTTKFYQSYKNLMTERHPTVTTPKDRAFKKKKKKKGFPLISAVKEFFLKHCPTIKRRNRKSDTL